ncbi:Stress response protein nst1 [Rhynchospora pubera]|uniref:Stress response protein nst1 n=1 Tax=Rhynchospora pubera TaxID=906938 RepID=A0AAV8FXT6_9POAL|nr:Stress response protein nst1 [Rhynchospora pubera]
MPGIWSRHRDEITIDRLQKFWGELPTQARRSLLRIDKQALFEQARKNLYCSRCNGLLLESFTQIVMYGKSLQQHHEGSLGNSLDLEDEEAQDPAVHPWGGLAATKDGLLTLLECFINSRSLRPLQNVFDSARAREREREMLYPDACGGEGRGWISQGSGGSITGYGRGHGTRETCALHTARLSCDTLMDFWSALGDETRASLLQMKEEDFIERLMYRFDSKRFCRDCRRNVIREFKELKELKRMRREPRCTSWFCGPDTAFHYEVSDSSVQADWHELFSEGKYHHFDWAVGTGEGKGDILDYQDVGMNRKVLHTGLDLTSISTCYISLRACRLDGRITELSVKAHALKGQLCVHRRLIVGDGFVSITKGDSMRQFFEHAEEAEEEDEEDAMERDGSDMDGDGSHPQKHAKSPELAREFLLDAATVIFKEQVEKAFREGTARQNAHSVFVSLALKLLEDRVHVACKEIITLEKQTKLLEEEEKEKREEEERKERRRTKEREKKLRRKERLKGKESREKETEGEAETESNLLEPRSPCDEEVSPESEKHSQFLELAEESESPLECSEISPHFTEMPTREEGEPSREHSEYHQCQVDANESFILEQSKSTRRRLKYSNDPGNRNPVTKKSNRSSDLPYRSRSRYEYHSCGCGDRGQDGTYHQQSYKPRQPYYRSVKFSNSGYTSDNFALQKVSGIGNGVTSKKDPTPKQVWEPMDSRKKIHTASTNSSTTSNKDFKVDVSDKTDCCSNEENTCQKHKQGETERQFGDMNHREGSDLELQGRQDMCTGYNTSNGSPVNHSRDLDNCSSCPSEGDSSLSSSSGPHNESSSSTSDSEDASQQSDGRDISTCTSEKNASIFPKDMPKEVESEFPLTKDSPHTCGVLLSPPEKENGAGLQVNQVTNEGENETKPVHMRNGVLPVHTQPVHGAAYYPSVGLGYHNQPVPNSWAGPTNGYPFSQPGHYSYPSHHLGYGITMQYTAPVVHPFPTTAPSFGLNQQPPVYKQYGPRDNTMASHPGLGPSGVDPIGNMRVLPPQNPNLERRAVNPSSQVPMRPSSNLMKNNGEKLQKEDTSHFSLFHFGGPMGCRDQLKLNDGKNGGHQCAREDNDVKEYNLFSSKGSFTFL